MGSFKKIVILSEHDNVLIACQDINIGESISYKEETYIVNENIKLGHKIARSNILKGESIVKFNMHIGSATRNIKKGEHVHTHNIKSDFIPTYSIKK